jgi:2-polyprenyl-6-methoxyphenol hydroxylase-like FAD-dependent oxidoreductase
MWFRISRQKDDPKVSLGRMNKGHIMIMIERGEYWQCGFVIPKGNAEKIKQKGLDAFKALLADLQPLFAHRVDELTTWDEVKLLAVAVDRLKTWYKPGLLCIGDSAHAMSPIGGVGINLAIQDAVAAANFLSAKLLSNTLTENDLYLIQKRREFPTKVTQRFQQMIQDNIFNSVLKNKEVIHMPLLFRILKNIPVIQRLPARFIGIGVRPEHVSKYLQDLYQKHK